MTPKYTLGTTLYLKTDVEQKERIVTGIMFRPSNVLYGLSSGAEGESWHYDFEMSTEKKY